MRGSACSSAGKPLNVLEPLQRMSSGTPLTLAQHIEDLLDVISREIPALI
jgi:hypothetical protein